MEARAKIWVISYNILIAEERRKMLYKMLYKKVLKLVEISKQFLKTSSSIIIFISNAHLIDRIRA